MLSSKTNNTLTISGHNTTATEIISITAGVITVYMMMCGVFYLLVKLY